MAQKYHIEVIIDGTPTSAARLKCTLETSEVINDQVRQGVRELAGLFTQQVATLITRWGSASAAPDLAIITRGQKIRGTTEAYNELDNPERDE
jgi:hypothetical protein